MRNTCKSYSHLNYNDKILGERLPNERNVNLLLLHELESTNGLFTGSEIVTPVRYFKMRLLYDYHHHRHFRNINNSVIDDLNSY